MRCEASDNAIRRLDNLAPSHAQQLTLGNASALQAIGFLRRFHPAAPWALCSFGPVEDQVGPARTFNPSDALEAERFIESLIGKHNVYFSVNCVSHKLAKKASKADITEIHYLHADIDLKGIDWSDENAVRAEKIRVLIKLQSHSPPPTVIIWSGGGYQAYWRLSEIIHVNGNKDLMAPVERRMQCLAKLLDGDACHNADRIMRLPGSINVLSKTKIAVGRRPDFASVIEFNDERIYDIEDFPEITLSPLHTNTAMRRHNAGCDELERIRDALRAIPADDYHIYLRVVMAVKSELGDSGFGVARDWAMTSVKFDESEFRRKWASIKSEGGVTLATLFALARNYGWHQRSGGDVRAIEDIAEISVADVSGAPSDEDDPLPLTRRLPAAEPFPLDALGPLKEPTLAIQAATQAPLAICANAVIATVALAGQAHVDVMLPTGQTRPICVDILTIAQSGERKTTVDNFAGKSIKQRQSELRERYQEEIALYVTERKAWEGQTRKIANDKKLGYRQAREKIAELGPEPLAPLTPLLIVHEPTVEGLAKLLDDGQPSIGIFTSEGGAFIGGHGFAEEAKLRTAAILSMLWDDGSMSRVRAGDGAKLIEGKRVSMHLQAQPDVGGRFFCDRILMDQGIAWRFLVAAPESTQGQRFWREVGGSHNSILDTYHQKVTALLQAPLPLRPGTRNELNPRPLILTPEAREFWIIMANEIECRVGPGGDLRPIAGFANKLAEHATRLAGILTVYDEAEAKEITKATMQNGFILATHYAQTAIRLHAAAHVNVELRDAESLLQWLHDKWRPSEGSFIALPELVQLGPNAIRDTRKARHLISILEQHRHLKRLTNPHEVKGKMRRDVWEIRSEVGDGNVAKTAKVEPLA